MIRPANIPEAIVETETVAVARAAVSMAIDMRYPVHIVGSPGTGKSSALWHIAEEHGGIYCEISQANKATKGMYELLLRSVNYWNGQKYVGELADATFRYFEPHWRSGTKLLIVDEVQTLEATAFRELLRVQEKCQLALVVAGNEERLAGKKTDKQTWEQIRSRLGYPRRLPGPSSKDCELIGATFNVEGRDAYRLLSAFGVTSNFRDLTRLLDTARRLSGATGIRKVHLLAALEMVGVKPEAVKAMQLAA